MLLIALIFGSQQCTQNKKLKKEAAIKEQVMQQNYRALVDTLRETKNKLGQIEYNQAAFVANMNELKTLNRVLYDKIEKVKGDVINFIAAGVTVKSDTLKLSNDLVKIDNETYGLKFKNTFAEPGFSNSLVGMSTFKLRDLTVFPGMTTISENTFKIDLEMGAKVVNNQYELFATCPSSRVKINYLNGVVKKDMIIPPSPRVKKFHVGPYIGIGIDQTFKFVPQIGIGLNYSLFSF